MKEPGKDCMKIYKKEMEYSNTLHFQFTVNVTYLICKKLLKNEEALLNDRTRCHY